MLGLLLIGVFAGEGIFNTIMQKDTGETRDTTEDEPEGLTGTKPLEIIKNIEFYLDGPKGSGIFLGETLPDRERTDVEDIYGGNFLNSGFEFTIELKTHNLKPGIHALFIYAITEEETTKYIIRKIIVKGEEGSQSIEVSIENPKANSSISSEKIKIQGWAIDNDSTENTGIDKVEIYLDGTMENGIFLGDGNYGTLTRDDIASTYGSQFAKSGYYLDWNTSSYRSDSAHILFAYAHSTSGEWDYTASEIYFTVEESSDTGLIIEIDNVPSGFEIEPKADLNISGWAVYPEPAVEDETISEVPSEYQSKKVVFVSDMNGEDHDLFIINLDGTQLFQLTDNEVDDLYPAVSSDGSEIAFTSLVDGYQQIMAVKIDGTGLRQVTHSETDNTYPSWSHDDKYIFFESKTDQYYSIYRVNVDGTDQKKMAFSPDYDIRRPACAFNKPLVFFEAVNDADENILIMDFEGEKVQSVITDENRNMSPNSSSSADVLAFSSYRTGNPEIYISTLAGDNIIQITSLGGENSNPSFSPDGKYIGFDSDIKGNLRIFIYSFEKEELVDLMDSDSNDYSDPVFLFY